VSEQGTDRGRGVRRAALLAIACLAAFAVFSSSAAAAPPLLGSFPEESAPGVGANQIVSSEGVAVDGSTGDVYVLDSGNHRILEFTAWGEFIRAWGWGVEDGSAEPQVCGPGAPEPNPDPGLCGPGLAGAGAGEIRNPQGIAVAPDGDVLVSESPGLVEGNARVQVFGPGGQFKSMFGGGVDLTTGSDICTAESGDECGPGVGGSGPGRLQTASSFPGGNLAVASDGTVYVGDVDRIEAFSSGGAFERELPIAHGPISGVAVDPTGGRLFYFQATIESAPEPPVYVVDSATGLPLSTVAVGSGSGEKLLIRAEAVDSAGDLFVAVASSCPSVVSCRARVLDYGPSGEPLIGYQDGFALPSQTVQSNPIQLSGLAVNPIGDLYVAETMRNTPDFPPRQAVSVYGPAPTGFGPPPQVPPKILDQPVTKVGETTATLAAKINPRFLDDTTYYVEYGLAACSAGGCDARPAPPGSPLTAEVVNAPILAPALTLKELRPATTYHYRFVASSGGGEAKGLTGAAGPAAEGTFTTESPLAAQPPCPANETFRTGPAATLPDCRAYEMVSPVDKNGADVSVIFNVTGFPAGLDQAAESGEALTYSAYRAFGDATSSPYASQYLATRGATGWTDAAISPPREGPSLYSGGLGLDTPYKSFTSDLCSATVLEDVDLPLAEGAVPGFPALYRRDVCRGGYELAGPTRAPTGVQPNRFEIEVQGSSADGSKTIFTAPGKLTNNASNAVQLYESGGGQLRMVCVLPNGKSVTGSCSAGAAQPGRPYRDAAVAHAISADGEVIYWTAAGEGSGGSLYARVGHSETVPVSSGEAQYWDAAADGSAAIYSEAGSLFEFDLAARASNRIAGGFRGLVGTDEGASVLYFVSTEAIAGSGADSEGDSAVAGAANLYRYDSVSSSTTFIARLSPEDLSESSLSDTSPKPFFRVARVSADGGTLAFISAARITSFDNDDAATGAADLEVYLYRAATNRLICASCSPTGARPHGRLIERPGSTVYRAAAQLPAAELISHQQRSLTSDGDRLFFESFDPLVPSDTNEQLDVYEWEASGTGNCATTSPGFSAGLEGCVNLISSGTSPQPSELIEATPTGRDVFFKTDSSLVPQDPDLVDVYDAREGGGFPPPPPPAVPCEGESCQSKQPAVALPPAAGGTPGPGNPHSKGKPKKKVRPHHRKRGHRHQKKSRRHHKGARSGR
jgi:hypothetical protein